MFPGPFIPIKNWAVGVSGGPDSLALLAYMGGLARQYGWRVVAIHVDCKLRPESTQQATQLQQDLHNEGVELVVLTNNQPVDNNIHHKIREIRYNLMMDYCQTNNIHHLALAHHADDRAENFLIRLGRRAGLQGLSTPNMVQEFHHNGQIFTWVRPFIAHSKQYITQFYHWPFAPLVDSNNTNPKYLRARIRAIMPQLAEIGVGAGEINAVMDNLAGANDYIKRQLAVFMQKNIVGENGYYRILPAFWGEEYLGQLAILEFYWRIFGQFPPKMTKINQILQIHRQYNMGQGGDNNLGHIAVENNNDAGDNVVLGGANKNNGKPLPILHLGGLQFAHHAGCTIIAPRVDNSQRFWQLQPLPTEFDEYFGLKNDTFKDEGLGGNGAGKNKAGSDNAGTGLQWRALGMSKGGACKLKIPCAHLPAVVIPTLPAIWHGGQIIAIPPLKYGPQQFHNMAVFGG